MNLQPSNEDEDSLVQNSDDTIDAFFRGRFYLVQPKHGGHKSGLDALLLASTVPDEFKGHVADLGSGAGAAGLAIAARCKQANITLVEYSSTMADYAKKTLKLPGNKWLTNRLEFIQADVTLSGKERQQAGLNDNFFDFVTMNPPFNEAADRNTPYDLRAKAHIMPDDMFAQWFRTAAAILKPGGKIAIIARPRSIEEILSGLRGRFGKIKLIFIHSRPATEATRIIILGKKGSRAPLAVFPSHFIHDAVGRNFNVKTDAIINGKQTLFE